MSSTLCAAGRRKAVGGAAVTVYGVASRQGPDDGHDPAAVGTVEAPVPPDPLVRTAVALMAATLASAGLTFVFWVVAARWFDPATVGRASAVVSAMTLLSALAQLNLHSLYTRFLPTAGASARRLVLGGQAACAGAAVLTAVGFLALGLGGRELTGRPLTGLLFTVGVLASAIFFVQDGVLAALHRSGAVPVKNALSAAAKLLLLPVLAGTATGDGILLAWVLPVVAVTAATHGWIMLRLLPAHPAAPTGTTPAGRRELLGFAAAEYLHGLANNVPAFLPPVLVAGALGDVAAAYFFIPWVIGVSVTTLLWNVVSSFVVAASADGALVREHARRAVALLGTVVGLSVAVLVAAATPLLRVFGAGYAEHGATALRVIALSLPFTAIFLLARAFAMLTRRTGRLLALQIVSVPAFVAALWWGLPQAGGLAPALALLAVQAGLGLAVLPAVIRQYRAAGSAAPEGATC